MDLQLIDLSGECHFIESFSDNEDDMMKDVLNYTINTLELDEMMFNIEEKYDLHFKVILSKLGSFRERMMIDGEGDFTDCTSPLNYIWRNRGDIVLDFTLESNDFEFMLILDVNVDLHKMMGDIDDDCYPLSNIKLLIDYGFDINIQNHKGNTILMESIKYNLTSFFSALLKCGISLDLQNMNGDTALMLASRRLDYASVEALIRFGASVDIQNGDGDTSLIIAAKRAKPVEDINVLLNVVMMIPESQYMSQHDSLNLIKFKGFSTIRELVVGGSDVKIKNKCGESCYNDMHINTDIFNIDILEKYGDKLIKAHIHTKVCDY
jgi:ankyrin repeat protein